ncbi:MAG: amino acid ABC transporter permease [Anaerolineaceae bacterium]|jgi:polar amino acid transport system permease protein|nr:amino acid ABC transporter permease [Anaerolineaceae bacterium]
MALLDIVIYILQGVGVTVAVTLIALPLGLVIGVLLALVRIYGGRVFSRLAGVYSTVMRGLPPIVLLFILYFIIAGSINISPFWAGSISLAIISSSYQMEIFRGAVLSVGEGQEMAARAIGMSRIQTIRYIILPQAMRLAIPPWSNEAATVVKDSSLVYALGVAEVLRRAQFVGARTYKPLMAFGIAALIYFGLVYLTSFALSELERKTRIPAF